MTKTETRQSTTSVRPVTGLTGATEFFWIVTCDGRLLGSGIAATETEARTAAEAVA